MCIKNAAGNFPSLMLKELVIQESRRIILVQLFQKLSVAWLRATEI